MTWEHIITAVLGIVFGGGSGGVLAWYLALYQAKSADRKSDQLFFSDEYRRQISDMSGKLDTLEDDRDVVKNKCTALLIENIELKAELKRSRDEIAELKTRMNNRAFDTHDTCEDLDR